MSYSDHSTTRHDLRDSTVNFGSFLDEVETMLTYVPQDETDQQYNNCDKQDPSPIVNFVSPQNGSDQNGFFANENPYSRLSPAFVSPATQTSTAPPPVYNLGAAIVSSRRPVIPASALTVDFSEITSALESLDMWSNPEPSPAIDSSVSSGNSSINNNSLSSGINLTQQKPTWQAPKLSPTNSKEAIAKSSNETNNTNEIKVNYIPASNHRQAATSQPPNVVNTTQSSTNTTQAPSNTPTVASPVRIETRASRSGAHSDAPRPIGLPKPAFGPVHSASQNAISSSTTNTESSSAQKSAQKSPNVVVQTPQPAPSNKKLATFEELLLEPNILLLKALCTCLQVTEATKTCASVILVFQHQKRSLEMIQSMINYEVSLQKTAATLFRNNSLTTHMMTCYTKLVGLPYLKTTIGPIILDAFSLIDSKQVNYEIDPTKLGPTDSLTDNIGSLKKLVHSFFDRILNSRAVMPRSFMEICASLQSSTIQRFPESRYFVIGGFLFLRYICPAVVAPDGYKLLEGTVTADQRRMLVLVSKILQTIANERNFGEKEEYMMCMNTLVNEYQGVVQYFFNQLAKPVLPETPENVPAVLITKEDYVLALNQTASQVKAAKAKLLASEIIQSDHVMQAIENIENLPIC